MTQSTKPSSPISAKRFAVYAAAGAAATMVANDDAAASVTYQIVDVELADTEADPEGLGQGIRLVLGDASSFKLDFFHSVGTAVPETGFALAGGGLFADGVDDPAGGASIAGFAAGNYSYASNLAPGVNLSTLTDWVAADGTATMAFNAGYPNEQFLDAGEGFLGFRFDTGSGFTYGWARVTMSGVSVNSFTVEDLAFASAGTSISVSQIPEPSSLALLAVGATGMAAWRRRRKAA